MGKLNVRIGINPISWTNDDLPQLGGNTPLETCLSEGTEIGYVGFELGNKFPKDPQALKDKLAGYGAVVVSGWYSGNLAQGTLEDEIEAVQAHLKKLVFNGCQVMVYGEVAGSVQGQQQTPLSRRPKFDSLDQWEAYAQKLNAFGAYLKTQGITLAYHHHMGAYVESPADVVVIGRVRNLQNHKGQHCSGIVLLLAIGLPGGGNLLQLVGAAAHQHGIELPRLLRHVQDDRILQQT